MSPSDERGALTERRFFAALSVHVPETPEWFRKIKRASLEYDLRGIDALAHIVPSDRSRRRIKIPIQIKSSEWGRRKYWYRKPVLQMKYVIVIVVSGLMTDDDIRRTTYELLLPYHLSSQNFDEFYCEVLRQPFDAVRRQKFTKLVLSHR